ncbi:hypothetical protein HRbin30_02225 [bacterium HR30]|nr:hypothetical protein HRbin30_02225 [bacterium HR30]
MSYWLRAWGPPGRPTPHPSYAAIVPEMFVGEYLLPSDVRWLAEELRVGAVLSLQDDSDLHAKNLSLAAIEQELATHGVHFKRIPVADGSHEQLLHALTPAVSWITVQASAGRRVYVHCNAGVNRAPTVAIAYLHKSRQLTLQAARDWVQERRACVPYWSVLEVWERANSG